MKLSQEQTETLLGILKTRFEKHTKRHEGIAWADVEAKLHDNPAALWSIDQMEETEGEPDVIGIDPTTGAFIFADCSPESPKGRRSVCYDPQALESRKEHKPKHSATGMAAEMGITLMDEAQYRHLQTLGPFDAKTSSWVLAPDNIRKLGGGIFGDYRYGTVFIYHNGAESYYAARGFRGILYV
ncbi:hypothetical protein AM493_13115 [Flavobacterium akiainvivens]|uniref:DUF4256 domain-containing protein n=1 Tax=Flavobacterium akiainvivens TaxID=1202724 RepID=A0A0M8MA90_9FLAO|nr:DUF4256 domain-containing protein [Flavobacterium akiainvivens]KOS06863.1 hypothetical protein AM493_13115 [Flavobacterium akiainvivens]SFQ69269.1 Protein of unknown function [Flavobacterium akiainvivens]